MKWLGPVPDEIDRDTSMKKVVLGQLAPNQRSEARATIEAGKTEVVDVKVNGLTVNGAK